MFIHNTKKLLENVDIAITLKCFSLMKDIYLTKN